MPTKQLSFEASENDEYLPFLNEDKKSNLMKTLKNSRVRTSYVAGIHVLLALCCALLLWQQYVASQQMLLASEIREKEVAIYSIELLT